jgi:hypothetical protein
MRAFVLALLALAVAAAPLAVQAEMPYTLSYQGVLKDSVGNPVPDGNYAMAFALYDTPSGGEPYWMEQDSVPVKDGVFNVILGKLVSLGEVSFDTPYWLGISLTGSPEMTPRVELSAAPYALHAASADAYGGGDLTVYGMLTVTSTADRAGVFTTSLDGCGVQALHVEATGNSAVGIDARGLGPNGAGTGGQFYGGSRGIFTSVAATGSAEYNALYASASGGSGTNYGVRSFASGTGTCYAIHGTSYGTGGTYYAGYFSGNVQVSGTLSKSAGSFRIDHPLDPANRYLQHSFVESPDMMNIYNGNADLDAAGEAWVELPDWFEALNQDFRYQLTAIGAPGPNLYVADEISGNRFHIAGGEAGTKVSWQVTGVRHDAYAQAHRIAVDVEKPAGERGKFLHPELLGFPRSMTIGLAKEEGGE